MEEGEFFEAVRTIIHKRVSAQTDTHFIDRQHLVGVHDAAHEITAIFRTSIAQLEKHEPASTVNKPAA